MADAKVMNISFPRDLWDRLMVRAAWEGAPNATTFVRDIVRWYLCEHVNAYEGVCGECGHVAGTVPMPVGWDPSQGHPFDA